MSAGNGLGAGGTAAQRWSAVGTGMEGSEQEL